MRILPVFSEMKNEADWQFLVFLFLHDSYRYDPFHHSSFQDWNKVKRKIAFRLNNVC
jgi:hypothetical protein